MSAINWPDLEAAQQPNWPDAAALANAQDILRVLPPLVFAGECDELTTKLADVSRGNGFVLMGGDCAETFAANTADSIRARLKTLLQMAIVLTYGASLPVVKIGRIAGQYGKPRSADLETVDGVSLPSYRGDAVNGIEFTAQARIPDPMRLVQTYHSSAAALNLVRAFTQGGYADLRQVHSWNQDFVGSSTPGKRYEQMAAEIDRALAFMAACGADPEEFRRADVYASHEALLLDYEKPMTRVDSRTGNLYDVSAHFLWIGERTRDINGAHVDFASRIKNPIGVKLGPKSSPDVVRALLDKLDPDNTPGRIMLITRMGSGQIREVMPSIVESVMQTGHPVTWVCDPMHGNTRETSSGHKTRLFDDVLDEVKGFFEVHRATGTHPGGIHIELTGDDVTECLGGVGGVSEDDLPFRYETACDPRLNRVQSLDLAFQVADMLR
ncbi:MAG: 3-deoxy-7-phosphoheptulonate synthase class II [Actinomycetes bacterium]